MCASADGDMGEGLCGKRGAAMGAAGAGHLAHRERGGSGSGRVIVKIRDHFTAVCR